MIATLKKIFQLGTNELESNSFNDKLVTRNQFAFYCAVLSLTYVFLFLKDGLLLPLAFISFSIFLFLVSIMLNYLKKYLLSSVVVLFATNFSVLFSSAFFGFKSGFHLYLFTSPLIVFVLYQLNKKGFIFLSIATYVANYLIISNLNDRFVYMNYSEEQYNYFYEINSLFSILLIISLLMYFSYNNKKINRLLEVKNEILIAQQENLKKENDIRKLAEEELKKSLKEKEVLLSEIHHRVKNNLAVVSALLELQATFSDNEKLHFSLQESRNRIKSIALLHEKLYENKTLERIDVKGYVDELVQFIEQMYKPEQKRIKIHSLIDPIEMGMKDAMPFGLLVNELITNSFKHAFKDREAGNIYITFVKNGSEKLLIYKDDGCGFDPSKNRNGSLGMNLIESFSKQLKGEQEISSNSGFTFKLTFQ